MDIPFEPIKKSLVGDEILLLAFHSIYWIYAMAVLFLLIIKSILHPLLFRFFNLLWITRNKMAAIYLFIIKSFLC